MLLDLKKSKDNLIIFLFSFIILFSLPLYDRFTEKYINESLKTSAITYATVRSINAVISVIKHSSVEIGAFVNTNIAIGEIVDPIDDAIERLSTLVTNSIWIIGSEKIIYELSKLKLFIWIILILAFLNIFLKKKFLQNIILILLLLRIYLPFSAFIFNYLDKNYFAPQSEKYMKIINYAAKNTAINDPDPLNKIKNKIIFYKQIFEYYKLNSDTIILSLLHLAAIFITKLVLLVLIIPLSFIFILKRLNL
jgi:hypothetical protein